MSTIEPVYIFDKQRGWIPTVEEYLDSCLPWDPKPMVKADHQLFMGVISQTAREPKRFLMDFLPLFTQNCSENLPSIRKFHRNGFCDPGTCTGCDTDYGNRFTFFQNEFHQSKSNLVKLHNVINFWNGF